MKKLILFIVAMFLTAAVFAAEKEKTYKFISYDLNGNFFNIKDFKEKTKAKYFVVDFMSIVCEPCKKALPDWEKEYPEMKKKGIEIVLVVLPSDKMKAKEEKAQVKEYFTTAMKVTFPVMYDLFYAVGDKFGVSKTEKETTTVEVPNVFLLDSEFRIVKQSVNHREIIDHLKKLK